MQIYKLIYILSKSHILFSSSMSPGWDRDSHRKDLSGQGAVKLHIYRLKGKKIMLVTIIILTIVQVFWKIVSHFKRKRKDDKR